MQKFRPTKGGTHIFAERKPGFQPPKQLLTVHIRTHFDQKGKPERICVIDFFNIDLKRSANALDI